MSELLDLKDEQIEKLEAELEKYQEAERLARDKESWVWTEHEIMDAKDDFDLPVPRLELVWELLDDRGYNKRCWYYLVYEHLLGDIVKVPMGMTKVSGGGRSPWREVADPNTGQRIDTPFRDHAHVLTDAKSLNLPAFVVREGKAQEMIPNPEGGCRFGPLKDVF